MILSLQRKFARESVNPKNDTYKQFREWITQQYPLTMGSPSDEEWEHEDSQYDYISQSPSVSLNYEITDDMSGNTDEAYAESDVVQSRQFESL